MYFPVTKPTGLLSTHCLFGRYRGQRGKSLAGAEVGQAGDITTADFGRGVDACQSSKQSARNASHKRLISP